jgi:hypothetical protein
MPFSTGERRLLSAPHRVIWAGFETTTARLQQAGWELSARQDFTGFQVGLAMRHQDFQCIAYTNVVDAHRLMMHDPRMMDDGRDWFLTFKVMRMADLNAHRIEFTYGCNPFEDYYPIDAKPHLVCKQIERLEDCVVFGAPMVETKELIVDEAEVSSILAKLVEAQKPEQERIRDRNRLRASREGMLMEAQPQRKFHAQILSIAA